MKKLAIRQKIGKWVYYVTTFTFKEVVDNVQTEWKSEMGLNSGNVDDRMQRELVGSNIDQIKNYILNQDDMFFNSLVLAVYNGNPQWSEIRIDYDNNESYNTGILELSDQDKIFPVDGQHRVEGIRKTIKETNGCKVDGDNYYNNQCIPVILIAHENTVEGKKRTRRLFTTLNRYAKPVNFTDLILLDEDDLVAITTRKLLDNNILFKDKVLLSQTKSIPQNDRSSFTNIQTLYDCNFELLKCFLHFNTLYINNGSKKVNPNSKIQLNELTKYRRTEEEINKFYNYLNDFWTKLATLTPIEMFLNHEEGIEKNILKNEYKSIEYYSELFLRGPINDNEKEDLDYMLDDSLCPITLEQSLYPFKWGGNLIFRPFGLIGLVTAICKLLIQGRDIECIIDNVEYVDLSLTSNIWGACRL